MRLFLPAALVVALDQITAYLEAGAVAVNLGGSLADPALVRDRKWEEIAKRAATAVSIVSEHKGTQLETIVH